MQMLHPQLLVELAHARVDDAVRTAARTSATEYSGAVRRRSVPGGRGRRRRSPVTVG